MVVWVKARETSATRAPADSSSARGALRTLRPAFIHSESYLNTMARQYSRSDYITDLAAVNARHERREHSRTRGPPIPDLRFEPTYMRKVGQHVRIEKKEGGVEVVHVEWGKVLWITTKDQILAPMLQGAVW